MAKPDRNFLRKNTGCKYCSEGQTRYQGHYGDGLNHTFGFYHINGARIPCTRKEGT